MDFSPDFTPRVKYKYVAAGLTHTILCRGRIGESMLFTTSRAEAFIQALATNLSTLLPVDWDLLSGAYIAEGSNVEIPIGVPTTAAGSVAVADLSKQDRITHLTFQGKTTGGAKANFKLYCPQYDADVIPALASNDFRFTPGDSSPVDATIAAIQALNLNGIDGLTINWYSFVNLKVNDDWLRKVRSGAA